MALGPEALEPSHEVQRDGHQGLGRRQLQDLLAVASSRSGGSLPRLIDVVSSADTAKASQEGAPADEGLDQQHGTNEGRRWRISDDLPEPQNAS